MQPMVRAAPRLILDSIIPSGTLRSLTRSHRPSIRGSACLQCGPHQHLRRYADDPKLSTTEDSSKTQQTITRDLSKDAPSEELPSAEEGRRSPLTKRFSHIMDHLQGNIFIASQRINDLTGYSGIEALKSRISALETRVSDAHEAVRSARISYKTTVADRAATQREVTTLLARKDSWTPIDLERFTSLYRMDHSNEQAVQEAATRLADTEREAEHAASSLSSSILSRYHEEQIWSDKIRRMSTWGTWGLMGVNILLFFVFQFGFEPWRRARLVHGFEEKVREALEKEKFVQIARHDHKEDPVPVESVFPSGVQELEVGTEASAKNSDLDADAADLSIHNALGQRDILGKETDDGKVDEQEKPASLHVGDVYVPTPSPDLRKPETWAPAFRDLFSQRIVTVKKHELTLVALEGAATGAVLVTIIATLLVRHA